MRDLDKDRVLQFSMEIHYQEAEKCLADALLVATEREYRGVAVLVREALDELKIIGRVCGINGQRLLEWMSEREVGF